MVLSLVPVRDDDVEEVLVSRVRIVYLLLDFFQLLVGHEGFARTVFDPDAGGEVDLAWNNDVDLDVDLMIVESAVVREVPVRRVACGFVSDEIGLERRSNPMGVSDLGKCQRIRHVVARR